MKARRYFRVIPHRQYFRLIHTPSGDCIQRHLCDFLTRGHAIKIRDAVIGAAPEFDWSGPGLFNEMPFDLFYRVWDALYKVKL